MSTHTSKTDRKTERHTGASFFRKTAALGLTACVLGGALITAPAAQAADIGWTPSPTKSVIGSPGEKGPNGHDLIDNLGVWPGQKVEYNIGVDLNVGDGDAVTSLSVEDRLPAGFEVDLASIRVVGDNALTLAASRDYKIAENGGVLTLAFSDAWVASHVGASAKAPLSRLGVSFTVTVSKDAPPYSSQENVVTQIVNGESFTSEAAAILIPGVDPIESVHGADRAAVGERIAVGGDQLRYSVKLDGTFGEDVDGAKPGGTPLELAYDVNRFGLIDDFDEKSVDISAQDVRIVDKDGIDRKNLFNVTSKGGVLTILAKATGDRGSVPASMLNKDYLIDYTAQVRNVSRDTNIAGKTFQVVDDREHPVAAESNVRVKAVAPSKIAVAPATEEAPESVLESVTKNAEFTYKLGSSQIPANRLVPLSTWTVVDKYTAGDRALHDVWSVVADADIHDVDGKVLIAKGTVLADQANTQYFEASFDSDSVGVTATKAFLELVNDDVSSDLGWSFYVQAIRTADEGTRVANTSHERSNGFNRTATVTTGTDAKVVETEPTEPEPSEPEPTEPAPEPTTPAEPAPSPEPTTPAVPEPSPEPTEPTTPAPSPEPTTPAVPAPSPEPTKPADPEPSPEPTTPTTPKPSPEPTKPADPKPSPEPTEPTTPKPSPEPTTPTTPKPSPEPTDPTTPKPSPEPTAPTTPKPSPEPTQPAEPAKKHSISIESFVTSEGLDKGDSDTVKDAYAIVAPEAAAAGAKTGDHDPVKVTYAITNTGETALEDVQLAISSLGDSKVTLGKLSGVLGDLDCEAGEGEAFSFGKDTLAVGETATCEGVVTEVKPGSSYADIATVTAVVADATPPAGDGVPADAKAPSVKDTDTLYASLAAPAGVVPAGDPAPEAAGPAAPEKAAEMNINTAGEMNRGAVTGMAPVSSTDPVMIGGGITAILAALAAGAMLMIRRGRASFSAKQ